MVLIWFKNIYRQFFGKTRYFYYFVVIKSVIIWFFVINTRRSLIIKQVNETAVILQSSNVNEQKRYENVSTTNVSVKYILLWTCPKCFPFAYFGEGSQVFINKKCKFKNCYVTSDRNYLGNYTEFDVIAFNGPQISSILHSNDLPNERNSHQKFVYANIESAKNYPIHTDRLERFFNWTWTYKLNSDAVWGYFVIKDANQNVIGPKQVMHWMSVENMEPIDEELKIKLKSKKNVAAWFSSNCLTISRREVYVESLQQYLKNYNMRVDVYGDCGPSQCPKEIMQHCLNMVRRDYYFYLAFENALSDDYVTEKVVYALQNDAIPVVYGGANYSRFLPEGAYLDALKLRPKKLAQTMYEIIQDPERYYNYFRWKKHYSYHFKHEAPETDDYCKFCAMINNKTLMTSQNVYHNFSSWWMEKVKRMELPDFDYDPILYQAPTLTLN